MQAEMKIYIIATLLCFCFKLISCATLSNKTFCYFAYGSNLLTKRILINNPSAVFFSVGKLDDYRLDFNKFSTSWNGTVATIVETPGNSVWGVVWKLNNEHMSSLDNQESWYKPINVTIHTIDKTNITCRTYELINSPLHEKVLQLNERPSVTYLHVIITGAKEHSLPDDYIEKLEKIPSNGRISNKFYSAFK